MAERWFYIDSLPAEGASAQLSQRESHHAVRVRRLKPGDAVALFDGSGRIARAVVADPGATRKSIIVAVESIEAVSRPTPSIHAAIAMPSSHSITSTMMSMLVQVGVNELTPLRCEHGERDVSSSARERWERIMLEACKQSRRAHLPEVHAVAQPVEVVEAARARDQPVIVAHPGGESITTLLQPASPGDRLSILVGPEAGFSTVEMEQMVHAGASAASLGDGILRIETAAVVAVSMAAIMLRG